MGYVWFQLLAAVLDAELWRPYRVGVVLWLPQVVVVPVD